MISLKGGELVMDWEAIFNWLEQKSGVSYDLSEDISAISGDTAFTEPFFWQIKISFILEDMESAIETVEEYRSELTEDLPPREKLQKGIENEYVRKLTENINNVKRQLGMSITPINDAEDVLTNVGGLFELISTMKALPIDSLQTREWFDKFDEENDNILTDVLQLHKNDLVDIHQTVETIVESLNTDDDEDDDDDMDMDMDEDV
jgi:hypothetical protein